MAAIRCHIIDIQLSVIIFTVIFYSCQTVTVVEAVCLICFVLNMKIDLLFFLNVRSFRKSSMVGIFSFGLDRIIIFISDS